MTKLVSRSARGVALLKAADFAAGAVPQPAPLARIGVIANRRSYRNKGRARPVDLPEAIVHNHEPASRVEIVGVLQALKQEQVELIVVDGGDGTVREVLGAAHLVYGRQLPRFAVIPSGKTNALAHDLGIARDWSLGDAIRAHYAGRVATRSPVRVQWTQRQFPDQFGFILGLGVFNRATMLAQRVHKRGLFNSAAVFFTIALGLAKGVFGNARSGWRRGDMVCLSYDGGGIAARRIYLLLATTLRTMPTGVKPFGPERDGLKVRLVEAPPRALLRHAANILRGVDTAQQAADGYHRFDAEQLMLQLTKNIVLDGEQFPGGHVTISRGAPIEFVVPVAD